MLSCLGPHSPHEAGAAWLLGHPGPSTSRLLLPQDQGVPDRSLLQPLAPTQALTSGSPSSREGKQKVLEVP